MQKYTTLQPTYSGPPITSRWFVIQPLIKNPRLEIETRSCSFYEHEYCHAGDLVYFPFLGKLI